MEIGQELEPNKMPATFPIFRHVVHVVIYPWPRQRPMDYEGKILELKLYDLRTVKFRWVHMGQMSTHGERDGSGVRYLARDFNNPVSRSSCVTHFRNCVSMTCYWGGVVYCLGVWPFFKLNWDKQLCSQGPLQNYVIFSVGSRPPPLYHWK